ncbi:MAG: helicase-exonuclease AddAB subunit AddA [Lachnospiraceae bacterium]
MAIRFSEEQQKVIDARGCSLLVSAAAGSGKTAVLVERIMSLITDKENPVDIDQLLIVTFTNAAAGEMRERIGAAIEERLSREPENFHLERQATLLHHAQITTIDSFCLFVIKNNFNEIGLDPGFRVADTGELELLKQDIIKELFEDLLDNEDTRQEFRLLLETLAAGGREKVLEDLIRQIYDFAGSFPWPEEWLKQRFWDYDIPEKGIEATHWGRLLKACLSQEWEQLKECLQEGLKLCHEPDGPAAYAPALESDLELVELLSKKEWQQQYELMQNLSYARLSSKKQEGVSEEKKAAVKALRDQVKNDLKTIGKKYFSFSPSLILQQMEEIKKVEEILLKTVLEYGKRFAAGKREKNLLDFGDMEHFALEILTCREENPNQPGEIIWTPSKTAMDYREFFKEIMIDEYQDSNLVQEYLLKSISGEWEGKYNRFMVGDLKQSIYRFRMARPEIFLEKYQTYSEAGGEQQCIHLHKNFRSRPQVLDSVNEVFHQLMTREIGKIEYTKKEALYPGAVYPKEHSPEAYQTELWLLDKPEREEKKEEARMVAHRINQLVGSFKVTDKETGKLREAGYKDVVILLRTNAGWDQIFYQELTNAGIPAVLTSKTGYFSAKEVQTVLNFLRVIDNPRQDIPLYGVMTSLLGRFTKDQIAVIKKSGKKGLYDNLVFVAEGKSSTGEGEQEKEVDEQLSGQAAAFLNRLNSYRDRVALIPIHQLLREYLKETGYLYYFGALPAGEQRVANVKMLLKKAESYEKTSYFGLFHFIRYMEQLQKYEVDSGEAGVNDEGRDAVRIMSIHKSKGLEFPICFVCGLHKKFNQMDSRQSCIMDMDLGLGLEYRNAQKRIRSADLRKSIIARKMELESLGEELRVLYVAMTRAKEKLILTGVVKDYEKRMLSYSFLKNREEKRLPFLVLSHAGSYLDLLLAATARDCPSIGVILWDKEKSEQELLGKAIESGLMRQQLEDSLRAYENSGTKEREALKQALAFCYEHDDLQGLYAKTTVSELKKKAMENLGEIEEGAYSLFEEVEVIPYLPGFMEKKQEVLGTTRGTAYHRVLELMEFHRLSDWKGLCEEMEELVQKGILDSAYPAMLSREKMDRFLSSALALRMKEADQKQLLFKEKPFVLGLPASLLNAKFPTEEKVLIQGIIDAFFEEEGELVLVDYKTDRITSGQELVLRYQEQLRYYQMALEQLTGKRVKEKLLYSFALGEAVACP